MRQGTVVRFHKKDEVVDPLTELLRREARELIGQAVSEEFEVFRSSTPHGTRGAKRW